MRVSFFLCAAGIATLAALSACRQEPAEAVPHMPVIEAGGGILRLDHPERFDFTQVRAAQQPVEINANATVAADVGRTVQVVSPLAGRVVETRAQLGDTVVAGQVLALEQSADLQQAYSDLQTASAEAVLAQTQANRARDLAAHGAVPAQEVEQATTAATTAQATLSAARKKLAYWGVNPDEPEAQQAEFAVRAPRAGVIIAQNLGTGAVLPSPDNSASLFTIADLSRVWVLCDVYENDLAAAHAGEIARVTFAAYPNEVFTGTVANVSGMLDPTTRVAKVRVMLGNADLRLKPGMFGTATLRARQTRSVLLVPPTAVVRTAEQDYIFISAGAGEVRRQPVTAGSVEAGPDADGAAGATWRPVSGAVHAGERVVTNALELVSASGGDSGGAH